DRCTAGGFEKEHQSLSKSQRLHPAQELHREFGVRGQTSGCLNPDKSRAEYSETLWVAPGRFLFSHAVTVRCDLFHWLRLCGRCCEKTTTTLSFRHLLPKRMLGFYEAQ